MRIALLATNGVLQEQLAQIREQLEQSGLVVVIASLRRGEIGSSGRNATRIRVDIPVHDLTEADLDGLIVPSHSTPVDLANDPDVAVLVSDLIVAGKLVGALGSGVLVLAGTKAINGRSVGADEAYHDELVSAGSHFNGQRLTIDNSLITGPDDTIDSFVTAFYDAISSRIRRKPPVQI